MARPTKFTRELGKACCALAREGNSRHAVAGLVGISHATLGNWLEGVAESISDEDHAEFLTNYAQAEAAYEREQVSVIQEAPDWKARAWIAERRFKHWRIPKDEAGSNEHAAPPTIVVQLPGSVAAPNTGESK